LPGVLAGANVQFIHREQRMNDGTKKFSQKEGLLSRNLLVQFNYEEAPRIS
jgi:hypothetical protein